MARPVLLAAGAAVGLALYLSGESVAQDGYPLESSKIAGATQTDEQIDGAELYAASCSSCHGIDGEGTGNGPSLVGVGEASANFQLTTGRMPLANADQAIRKEPAFNDEEIQALVAHVGTFGDGPAIPEVDLEGTDLSAGQASYIENCAACHGATGAGGAVGNEALAPSLYAATDVQVAEAVIVGPGQMPQFEFSEAQLNDIVNFVIYLREEPRPGGADIGGIGPVPEGFVAWFVGMGALLVVILFVGSSRRNSGDGEDAA
ncbi:MAG: cytochrome bc1 complex diheme cytochrome c subunit [Actinomycetota bacterium]